MLHSMQQAEASAPAPNSPSFAGLLAALTAPTPRTAWNNDDLAEDVATLSYEHALRAHSRYKQPEPGEWGFAQAADLAAQAIEERRAESISAAPPEKLPAARDWSADTAAKPARGASTMLDRNLKRASITIRLSEVECEQLRSRAAQAGLTVSAYLRSCTFEAEALRAQVKEALAELRKSSLPDKSTVEEKQRMPVVARRSWFEWLLRLMPHWPMGQRVARA
jgi:hypothetical protein